MWEFEAVGLPALQKELTGLEDALADSASLLAQLAPEVGADIKQNFLVGGRPETWPDITAVSRARRKVNKTSGPLIDTEALMNAASASEEGVEGSVFGIAGDTETFGTDLPGAATQQYGRGGIAARAYEQITDADELRLAASLESDYLHAMLAGSAVL